MIEPDLNEDERALLKAEEAAKRSRRKWDEKINALRKKVAKTCQHKRTVEFKYESDDGYGHWYRGVGHRCLLCGKQNKYPTMSNSPINWYDPCAVNSE